MQSDMVNKNILVTAGASGIGRAIALAFATAGASVHVCDIDEPALAEMRSLGIRATRTDVSISAEVDALFDEIEADWKTLDILVNNAGIAGPTKQVEEITDQEWESTLKVNISGQFYCVRRAVPLMKRQQDGVIINISSTAGRIGMPLRAPYTVTKYAVRGFTDVLAIELGGHNIRVNTIMPGLIDGPRGQRVVEEQAKARGVDPQEYLAAMLHNISLHSMIGMEEIAATALFLASDLARNITGQAISVCGNFETYRSPLNIQPTEKRFSVA